MPAVNETPDLPPAVFITQRLVGPSKQLTNDSNC